MDFGVMFAITTKCKSEHSELDEEELEFELSWKAAEQSRGQELISNSRGYVLALEIEPQDVGAEDDCTVEATKPIMWSQVDSVLVADSEERELSWYAPQEVATYLPTWLP